MMSRIGDHWLGAAWTSVGLWIGRGQGVANVGNRPRELNMGAGYVPPGFTHPDLTACWIAAFRLTAIPPSVSTLYNVFARRRRTAAIPAKAAANRPSVAGSGAGVN